jgi:hypothetical protein
MIQVRPIVGPEDAWPLSKILLGVTLDQAFHGRDLVSLGLGESLGISKLE